MTGSKFAGMTGSKFAGMTGSKFAGMTEPAWRVKCAEAGMLQP
jgi:hypothetical protein